MSVFKYMYVDIYIYIYRNSSLFFSCQLSYKVIAELLKNAPVLLKR